LPQYVDAEQLEDLKLNRIYIDYPYRENNEYGGIENAVTRRALIILECAIQPLRRAFQPPRPAASSPRLRAVFPLRGPLGQWPTT
jgi:hypothetical protein